MPGLPKNRGRNLQAAKIKRRRRIAMRPWKTRRLARRLGKK
jgi:hypothetical protein